MCIQNFQEPVSYQCTMYLPTYHSPRKPFCIIWGINRYYSLLSYCHNSSSAVVPNTNNISGGGSSDTFEIYEHSLFWASMSDIVVKQDLSVAKICNNVWTDLQQL